jgi:hypothetical protein
MESASARLLIALGGEEFLVVFTRPRLVLTVMKVWRMVLAEECRNLVLSMAAQVGSPDFR